MATTTIEAAIQTYLDGLYEGDADKLASVFHPTCALTWDEAGTLTILPRDAWLERVRTRPSPRSRGLERRDKILLIDEASPTTALVKLNCAVPPRHFTDYLCLIKLDGSWQIVQKVYAFEVREEA